MSNLIDNENENQDEQGQNFASSSTRRLTRSVMENEGRVMTNQEPEILVSSPQERIKTPKANVLDDSVTERSTISRRSVISRGSRNSEPRSRKMLRINKKAIKESQQQLQEKKLLDRKSARYSMTSKRGNEEATGLESIQEKLPKKNLITSSEDENYLKDDLSIEIDNIENGFRQTVIQQSKPLKPDPYGLISGTGGHPVESQAKPFFTSMLETTSPIQKPQGIQKFYPTRGRISEKDEYMSYTEQESELEIQTLQNQFELDSSVSVAKLPPHGYTSGFTDGIQGLKHKKSSKKNSKVLIDDEPQENVNISNLDEVIQLSRKGSKNHLHKKPSPREKDDFIEQKFETPEPDTQSDGSSLNFRNRLAGGVINRKQNRRDSSTMSQSSFGQQQKRYEKLDIDSTIMEIDHNRFYHPYAQQMSVWDNIVTKYFEMFELSYLFVFDLLEGFFSLISRFFCGIFSSM